MQAFYKPVIDALDAFDVLRAGDASENKPSLEEALRQLTIIVTSLQDTSSTTFVQRALILRKFPPACMMT